MNAKQEVKGRILIVDDEPAIRNLIRSLLSDRFTCTTAESAEAALRCLEAEAFDLMITDVNLGGGMNGIELVRRVVASAPGIVVLVISADPSITPIEAIANGAFDYIRKPFDIDTFTRAVDRAMAHRALLVSKRKRDR